jgi:hypothetical protein
MAKRFAIAHVTPHPWESGHPVNVYVADLAAALGSLGHDVLVVAPSRSPQRVRETRRALRGARSDPQSLLAGSSSHPRVLAIGEAIGRGSSDHIAPERPQRPRGRAGALPVDAARALDELFATLPLDFVHVHDPFPPSLSSAALRHSRSLNVGTFHAASPPLLPGQLAQRILASTLRRLDARTASSARATELLGEHFPGDYELLPCGAGAHDSRGAARALEALYRRLDARRHAAPRDDALARELASRPLIDVDLHMHTDHSFDCATPVEVLLATARKRGLHAIAVTDHNEISGALRARELAPEHGVEVIVGEEVKTAHEGEVIGLFIEQQIPPGMTLRETIAAIHRQGGIAYVPHPFDRLHSVPDYQHLLPLLDQIDAIEIFNPRVALDAYNDEAMRFAAKYRIPAGAGSDAHVPQGLGSVRVRMRDFDGPREFLRSLAGAQVLTGSHSLLYVQALKFLQTKATPAPARRARAARRVRRAGERARA